MPMHTRRARYLHLPNIRSLTREMGRNFRGWALYVDGRNLCWMGRHCKISHESRSKSYLVPLSLTPLTLPFPEAGATSNNTAEMTAMIEALYCLGPPGSGARQEEACIFYDFKHAAGICLGTIQARTHIQLAYGLSAVYPVRTT